MPYIGAMEKMKMETNNELLSQLIQVIIVALIATIPIVAGILAQVGRQYLQTLEKRIQAEIGANQWRLLRDKCYMLVMAADQMAFPDGNPQRFEYVVNLLIKAANELNVNLTYEQAEAMVEGTLKGIKDDQSWSSRV